MNLKKTIAGVLLSMVSLTVHAHYIWLEPSNNEAKLYFGEYGENLREKTGGRLDTIATPTATAIKAGLATAVSYVRKDNYLAIEAAGDIPLQVQDIGMEVKDLRKYNIGIVKPMYYARFAVKDIESPSTLDLDIQPLGGGKVKVSLHGKPLEKAKLEIFAPNQWMQEFNTDADGEVSITTPWPGLYVLHVVYVEAVAGKYQGADYEGIRHVSTLSFVK